MEFYGTDVQKAVAPGPLKANNLIDGRRRPTALLRDLAGKTLELQTDIQRPKSPSQTSLDKYRKMLGEGPAKTDFEPTAVVAPYFYFEDLNDPWYRVNVASVQETLNNRDGRSAYAVISTGLPFVLSANWKSIAEDLKGVDGVMLWVSGFVERQSSISELRAVALAVRELSRKVETIHMLYGGYFSLTLASVGLSRLSFGICYGDSKSVDFKATGGGFATRYYLSQLKMKTVLPNAQTFFSDHPAQPCHCAVCTRLCKEAGISGKGKPTVRQIGSYFDRMDGESSNAHFMAARHDEANALRTLSPRDIARYLRQMEAEAAPLSVRQYELHSDHLGRWAQALETS